MRKKVILICIGIILFMVIGRIYLFTDEPYELEYLENPDEIISSYVVFPYWYEECKMKPDMVHRYPLIRRTGGLLDEGKEGYLLYYRHSGRDGKGFEFAVDSEGKNLITDVKDSNGSGTDELFAIVSFDAGTFEMDQEPDIEMNWQHNEYVKELFLALKKEPYEADIQYLDDISDYPNVTEAMEYWYSRYDGPSVFPIDDGYLLMLSDHMNQDKQIEAILETSGSLLSIRTNPTEDKGNGRALVLLPRLDDQFKLEDIYLDGNAFPSYFVDETLQMATIGWTDWSFLLNAPEGLLADEIVDEINFKFQPSPNSLHCIIRSTFNAPEELHFGSFLQYFQLMDTMSEEEKKALENSDVWMSDRGVDDLPVPTKPYRADTINKVLEYYLGISFDELNEEGKEGYIYFPEYDTYYTQSSDWGPGMFICTWGEKEDTQVKLYGESIVNRDFGGIMETINSCIVLEETEGRYLFKSHTESEELL